MVHIKQLPEDFVVNELYDISPQQSGTYAYFVLCKKNRTTLDAVQQVARQLRIEPKRIGFAGVKDKTAITTQLCSAKDVSGEAIKAVHLDNITLTYLGRGNTPVSLGTHAGNAFRIVVRDITSAPAQKEEFINYFGEQRFSKDNASIGRALIKNDFETAASALSATHSEVRAAITQNQKDKVGAIKKLQFRLLKLYVHSYQSLLWNRAVREHIRAGHMGSMPLPGFGMREEACIMNIMKQEGLTQRQFVLSAIPELSAEGGEREVFIRVKLSIGPIQDDELNKGKKKVQLEFSLPKGSYATECVRQLFEKNL